MRGYRIFKNALAVLQLEFELPRPSAKIKNLKAIQEFLLFVLLCESQPLSKWHLECRYVKKRARELVSSDEMEILFEG